MEGVSLSGIDDQWVLDGGRIDEVRLGERARAPQFRKEKENRYVWRKSTVIFAWCISRQEPDGRPSPDGGAWVVAGGRERQRRCYFFLLRRVVDFLTDFALSCLDRAAANQVTGR